MVAFVEDQLARYGMRGVCVVWFGGEPLLQPQLFDIMAAVHARGMFVFEINTNGRFLIAQVFANIASFGFKPEMKISFNGLGFQDWMRGCEGAEQDALRAIKLCVDAGFPTRVQMNINRKNRDSILPSLALLDDMGVGRKSSLTRRRVVCQDLHGVEALEFASGPVCTQCRGPLRKAAIRMRF